MIELPQSTLFINLEKPLLEKWTRAQIRKDKLDEVMRSAKTALKYRERYESLASTFGPMPWYFVAGLHMRESEYSFNAVLHNGEHILGTGKKTSLVPRGRGPFNDWREAAVDALKMKFDGRKINWSLGRLLFEATAYNGFGYNTGAGQRTVPARTSPYLWSMTDEFVSGKYVADRRFSSTAVDKQVGVAALWKALEIKGVKINSWIIQEPGRSSAG